MITLFSAGLVNPEPNANLGISGEWYPCITGGTWANGEAYFVDSATNWILARRIPNALPASALIASSRRICVKNSESALRSFNRRLPAELPCVRIEDVSTSLLTPTDTVMLSAELEGIGRSLGPLIVDAMREGVAKFQQPGLGLEYSLSQHELADEGLHAGDGSWSGDVVAPKARFGRPVNVA